MPASTTYYPRAAFAYFPLPHALALPLGHLPNAPMWFLTTAADIPIPAAVVQLNIPFAISVLLPFSRYFRSRFSRHASPAGFADLPSTAALLALALLSRCLALLAHLSQRLPPPVVTL